VSRHVHDLGSRAEAVLGRGEGSDTRERWGGSLQQPRRRLLDAARALANHDGEQELRTAEAEPADGTTPCSVGGMPRVVRYAPRPCRHPKKCCGKNKTLTKTAGARKDTGQGHVYIWPRPLGSQSTPRQCSESGARPPALVKCADLQSRFDCIDIRRGRSPHQAGKAADAEKETETRARTAWAARRSGSAPQRRRPVEHLHAGGHALSMVDITLNNCAATAIAVSKHMWPQR